MERLAAIVLAAGRSARMRELKPLLDVEGRTLLERAVGAFSAVGIDDVLVVTGHRGDEVAPVAARAGARTVHNPRFDEGMYSSVQAGVAAMAAGVTRFFLLPADVPLVRPETVGQLARAAGTPAGPAAGQSAARGAAGPAVVYPAFRESTGHPPLISASLRDEILGDRPAGGLRELLMRHAASSQLVEVEDPGVLLDADTPEALARIRELAAGEDLPDEARCLELLRERGTPDTVVSHTRAVAAVATALAAALNERGQHLCEPLVAAGALLHDLARDQPRHADAGADVLEHLGIPRVAAVVRRHMGLDAAGADTGEAEVVYLADKLVEGDRLVGLDARFAARLARFARHPSALAGATARRDEARDVLRRVEDVLERSATDVLPTAWWTGRISSPDAPR
jgi:CTP:molybdopterin cytidylyltransferase MocA